MSITICQKAKKSDSPEWLVIISDVKRLRVLPKSYLIITEARKRINLKDGSFIDYWGAVEFETIPKEITLKEFSSIINLYKITE